ncbi:hypothetical protein U9M48_001521 [Paspalum notatum var. saurae]|uniref:Uncharacterized protein n=1 Tax=Paspalum notatum var. saurae TaxID=547442 RepID=A0AAQ3PGH8_PASNO
MREEFDEVFQAIGWSEFAEIPEGGIALLTKEFLMTLRTDTRREGTFVWFRLFNIDYELTLRQFSNLLDFSPQCSLSDDLRGFNLVEFWKELVGPDAPRKRALLMSGTRPCGFSPAGSLWSFSRRMTPAMPQ